MKNDFRVVENIDLSAENMTRKFGKNQAKDGFSSLTGINASLSGRQCTVVYSL